MISAEVEPGRTQIQTTAGPRLPRLSSSSGSVNRIARCDPAGLDYFTNFGDDGIPFFIQTGSSDATDGLDGRVDQSAAGINESVGTVQEIGMAAFLASNTVVIVRRFVRAGTV